MKIFAQFVSSLVGGILSGLIGLVFGTGIGASLGFPRFGGNMGYEAGGAFFAIVGISLGSLLGIVIAKKIQKDQPRYTAAVVGAIATMICGFILFDYRMPLYAMVATLLMPPVVLTVLANMQKNSK